MATDKPFDRNALEQLINKRFFYAPAFGIYGGVAGLYDYGPTGCALQANILALWRNHFVLEEEMLELDTTIMTPHDVLKTSGHVDKFADWMCKDLKNGEIFRADHLVEAVLEARLQGDKDARFAQGHVIEKEVDKDDTKEPVAKKTNKKKVRVVAVALDAEVKQEYEEILAKIDNYTGPELGAIMHKYTIKSPETGNDLSEPEEFNLMFQSSIGPTGQLKGYLRPETAQGQFLNFKKLLEFNNDKMPFASASIGRSFRNEISPRSGLLRVRYVSIAFNTCIPNELVICLTILFAHSFASHSNSEFTMAEIEHFVDPLNKDHVRFDDVKDVVLNLLPASVQQAGKTDITPMTIDEAVAKGIVDNKTLGYFLARIYLFLTKLGIKKDRLRFRQHMPNEMAHYACDCWDAEIQSSYVRRRFLLICRDFFFASLGWIECVGCADRSAYDLTVHSNRTKEKLVVREQLPEPKVVERWQLEINKKVFGPKYKKQAKVLEEQLLAFSEQDLERHARELEQNDKFVVTVDGEQVEITRNEVTVQKVTVTEHGNEYALLFVCNLSYNLAHHPISPCCAVREYTPNVIEPSFGIGRILYSLIEHVWWAREDDENRNVLSFPAIVAPFKCALLPLSGHTSFVPIVRDLSYKLRRLNISSRTDDSKAAIGRRYSRNDELGIPFALTIDFQTVQDGTVTLRERDTTKQIRQSVEVVLQLLRDLSDETITWTSVLEKYPLFVAQEVDEQ
ncbi:glycyl-tRNA synthetase [Jimgerdemannia flammicorona]|uniref:Glycyl-tRNA synthetase n=1 Tax=Jimgerdemannia flammicorona TaxID=994334 RepID=A0A433QWI7_9FUNG|nr:glycyl-tRNA synthetase [Jimgerdemannia flammicorona]